MLLTCVAVGSLVSFLVGLVSKTDLPVCKDWNKFCYGNFIIFHKCGSSFICELAGLNAWNNKNGAACQTIIY